MSFTWKAVEEPELIGCSPGTGSFPGEQPTSWSGSGAVVVRDDRDAVSGEWAHVAAVFVLTPEGKVSRYLYGIEYPPKDLRLSLVEAA